MAHITHYVHAAPSWVAWIQRVWRRVSPALLIFALAALGASLPVRAATLLSAHGGNAADTAAHSEILLRFDDKAQWRWFRLSEPARIVIDVQSGDASAATREALAQLQHPRVKSIRLGDLSDGLRVVLDLVREVPEVRVSNLDTRTVRVTLADAAVERAVAPTVADRSVADPEVAAPVPLGPITTVEQRPVIVVLDPGHGGKDSGAVGPTGLLEKHVALSIARETKRLLEARGGYTVLLTRDGDAFIPLRDRIGVARAAQADLFVSIHADAFHDRRAHGSSVYVLSNRGASSEYARLLARRENAVDMLAGIEHRTKDDSVAAVLLDISMNAAIDASTDIAARVLRGMGQLGPLHKTTVQRAGFVVLKAPDVPSILVETAFISNPREERNLGSINHRRKIASALARGIEDYFTEYRPSGVVQVARGDALQREHRVRSGETLSGIAERYGISLQDLRSSNDLRNDTIRVGQSLRIPVRTASR
ncbi:MAG: N-acetylmuramoyl-L-alanine amidase [Oceanococcaceae bacterium]